MIENVGNLVCPALFDLGERAKVVDPLGDRGRGQAAEISAHVPRRRSHDLLNKIDLLPHVDFDVDARDRQCRMRSIRTSLCCRSPARSGEGLADWYGWLRREIGRARETAFA